MGLKKKLSNVSLRISVAVLLILLTAGWGQVGHRIINSNVILHLPATMGRFIQQGSFLAQHASDADYRKDTVATEAPKHFIDIDAYSEFATHSVTHNLDSLVNEYGSGAVTTNGTIPWAAVWTLDSLTAQIRRSDWQDVWQSAADLGHYAGDAHQPLHATKYYGGGNSSSRPGSASGNIHSRYETNMINLYQSAITI